MWCCCTQDFPADEVEHTVDSYPARDLKDQPEVESPLPEEALHAEAEVFGDSECQHADAEEHAECPPEEKEAPQALCTQLAPIPVYECVVEREAGTPWGMELDPMHPYLQVAVLKPEGAIDQYNATTADDKLEVHDLITRVNGVEVAPKRMLQVFKDMACDRLEIQCVRPEHLEVTLQKDPEQPWGISVEYQSKFTGLLVKSIMESSIAVGHLVASDLIISINNIAGKPTNMRDALKTSNLIKLNVLRISRGPSMSASAGGA